jgi:hypothetical protein
LQISDWRQFWIANCKLNGGRAALTIGSIDPGRGNVGHLKPDRALSPKSACHPKSEI